MAVAYFKAPYWYFLKMIYENDKNLSRQIISRLTSEPRFSQIQIQSATHLTATFNLKPIIFSISKNHPGQSLQPAPHVVHLAHQSYVCCLEEFVNTFNLHYPNRMKNQHISDLINFAHAVKFSKQYLSCNIFLTHFMGKHRMLESFTVGGVRKNMM